MNLEFINWLKSNNWEFEVNNECKKINNNILERYNNIPKSFIDFIVSFKSITSQDETTWFLCNEDYIDDSDDAFRWNEFELMSLEVAENDEKWKKEIIEWWDYKLPFLISVKNGYSFFAIDLVDNIGAIVKGEEPEFEEVMIVADNFEDFIIKLLEGKIVV